MGKYPVISISMSGVNGTNFAEAREMVVKMISEAAYNASAVLTESPRLSPFDKNILHKLEESEMGYGDMITSLRVLSKLLAKHYGKKVILLIDEYDVPLSKAYESGYYDDMAMLMRNLLEQSVKTNPYYKIAVMTGCLHISKESFFTGLNNLKVWSASDEMLSQYFGFTENEVCEMLEYYGISDKLKTVKNWYDGYLFGNTHIYCPWDVVCFCNDLMFNNTRSPQNHWINTSENSVIRKLIEQSGNNQVKNEIERLINGEAIEKEIHQELTYKDMYDSGDNIWSLLYMTGYLTQETASSGRTFRLVIPNHEIRQIFIEQILKYFRETLQNDTEARRQIYEYLLAGNANDVRTSMNSLLEDSISIRDNLVCYSEKESFYHGLLIGLLGGKTGWDLSSNREAGRGYYDILLTAKDCSMAILIEIKYAKESELGPACHRALNQIEAKRYAEKLYSRYVRVLKYGMAFHQKECMVLLEE